MTTPLPCPFCGQTPAINPRHKGIGLDCYGEVACLNESCTVNPSTTSRHEINGNEGVEHYQQLAIANWNLRLNRPEPFSHDVS